jgi:hypothetical protein
MTFTFYTLGEYSPCLTFTTTGVDLWDAMCESIVDHVLGVDPWSETPARDIVDIVEMQTADDSEYVEAVYVQGKLVGSLNTPFFLDPSEYAKI